MSGPEEAATDDGQRITILDVVGGMWSNVVGDLVSLHQQSFEHHTYAADRIVADAKAPSHRVGLITHQWLVLLDGVPAAYTLFDTNLRRRISPMHYLAVRPDHRLVTVEGIRLSRWIVHNAAACSTREGGEAMLGVCGETPFNTLGIFLNMGWTRLDVDYLEPVHGWRWPELGLATRSVALIWLPKGPQPPTCASTEELNDVAEAASASFLIDTYSLPGSEPFVAALTGRQRFLDGARRHQPAVAP